MKEEAVTSSGERILVPLDGLPLAELALVEALALARLPNTDVMLLPVIPPIEGVITIGPQEIWYHELRQPAMAARLEGDRTRSTTARHDGCVTPFE